jgi:hypothetical protein
MRKFIIELAHGKTNIQEVEIEIVTPLEDPSVMWLPQGEYRAHVVKPRVFTEKDGKKSVWCSFVFCDDLETAKVKAEHMIRDSFEFELRKYSTEFTEEQVQTALAEVQVVML